MEGESHGILFLLGPVFCRTALSCSGGYHQVRGDMPLHDVVGILLLLKKVGSARLRESDIHPISSKTSAPQYQPIDRKKRKGKIVEDYSRYRAA